MLDFNLERMYEVESNKMSVFILPNTFESQQGTGKRCTNNEKQSWKIF